MCLTLLSIISSFWDLSANFVHCIHLNSKENALITVHKEHLKLTKIYVSTAAWIRSGTELTVLNFVMVDSFLI